MTVASLTQDWLINNAVVVFASALLVGQTWGATGAHLESGVDHRATCPFGLLRRRGMG